ncbi:MAG: YifB family Mg chelatase-like AAA ATPase [Roseiflexaceae bacterium]|nr:YifB family Mg chelatase-like AAA ATPase [Roseiflexaceae bacterium]
MLAKVRSCAVVGLEGLPVEVEVYISEGLPALTIVGLGDTAVQESRERVRAAVRTSGASFPMKRITVNLAPADLRKAGPSYDLPIAVGLLIASGQITAETRDAIFIGELGLDGSVRHTDGVLPMVAIARDHGIRRVFVPAEDAAEAALIEGPQVIPVPTLGQLARHLVGDTLLAPYQPSVPNQPEEPQYHIDFRDVKGQEHVKRALEVAAAGQHNLLMSGSPGAGKTLMARALVSILPPLSLNEALDVTKIYSVSGMLPRDTPLIRQRPFCAPHHTTSLAGLVGGGAGKIRPGMVSLAHRGVLFLDELPEFGSKLDVLRQPIEDRTVTISRASGSITYPAAFMLIAAQNPCICGWYGDPERTCTCTPAAVARYQRRVSGPLLDRIDMYVDVPRVQYEKLNGTALGEPSAAIRARVGAARERQRMRFRRIAHCLANADMGAAEVRELCQLDAAAQRLMQAAMRQLQLSGRAYHRVLKLARTIADLAGADAIAAAHLAEALQYRQRRQE